jgi:hypothetical protein
MLFLLLLLLLMMIMLLLLLVCTRPGEWGHKRLGWVRRGQGRQ